MNYDFKAIDTDSFELQYDKETKDAEGNVIKERKIIPFKRTIALAKRLQSLDAEARFKMLTTLNEMGKTKQDLTIERVENGKKVIDETNYREFENQFLLEERYKMTDTIFKDCLGMTLIDTIQELGLEKKDDALIFATKLREILTGGGKQDSEFPR